MVSTWSVRRQTLLSDALPELTAHCEQQKVKADRSAIHRSNAPALRKLINRVAKQVGKPAIQG
jgi:hypothetical protein